MRDGGVVSVALLSLHIRHHWHAYNGATLSVLSAAFTSFCLLFYLCPHPSSRALCFETSDLKLLRYNRTHIERNRMRNFQTISPNRWNHSPNSETSLAAVKRPLLPRGTSRRLSVSNTSKNTPYLAWCGCWFIDSQKLVKAFKFGFFFYLFFLFVNKPSPCVKKQRWKIWSRCVFKL